MHHTKTTNIKKTLRSAATHLHHIKSSSYLVSSFFALAVVFMGVGIYQFNQPATNASNECNTNDIVASGIRSQADITRHHNANTCGDFRAIYDHYWIKPHLTAGDKVYSGQANNRGEVVANGRVVAKNAESIGRHAIKNSRPISIKGKTYYQTSHVGGRAFANPNASLATLVVLDKDGNFKYALVKDCGNPIYATPNNPPKPPKPVVKDIQVCEIATKKIITIKEDQFNPAAHSKNLEDCKVVIIEVCDLTTQSVIKIDEKEFDSKKHSKNVKDCVKIEVCDLDTNAIIKINEDQFDSKKHSKDLKDCSKIQVCVLKTKEIATIRETGFDATKHSKNFDDCKTPDNIIVCDLTSKQAITITEEQFDATKHSKDLKDCEAKCPIPGFEHLPAISPECATPVELPKTGPADFLASGVGFAAMGLAAHYYLASRRR